MNDEPTVQEFKDAAERAQRTLQAYADALHEKLGGSNGMTARSCYVEYDDMIYHPPTDEFMVGNKVDAILWEAGDDMFPDVIVHLHRDRRRFIPRDGTHADDSAPEFEDLESCIAYCLLKGWAVPA